MGKIFDAIDKYRAETDISGTKEFLSGLQRQKVKDSGPVSAPGHLNERRYSNKLVTLLAPTRFNSEMFKSIRGMIFHAIDRPTPKAIMVTSAFPGEGKTYVAANLAVSLARGLNDKVLLIDADLRRPAIHKMFGYADNYGLSEYLQGKKDISELLIKTDIDNLTLLLSGELPPNPAELLSSKKMNEFVREAKERYQDRFLIIDVTPSQMISETNIMATHVDGVILVVRSGQTPRAIVKKTVESIGRERILGVVFNGFTQSFKDYNKYYRGYY